MKNKVRIKKAFILAFTLAEIMIALVVIGVITSILLPVAFNSVPDENVMKFKKGNATLAKVINELVSSDKYYSNGDLGTKADGNLLNSNNEDDIKYLCESFADVVSTKSVNCSSYKEMQQTNAIFDLRKDYSSGYSNPDIICKNDTNAGEEIVTTDGIVYYQTAPAWHFGFTLSSDSEIYANWKETSKGDGIDYDAECVWCKTRLFEYDCQFHCDDNIKTKSSIYKVFCMDIDGIGKGEDPFGYGIRVDGKIVLGDRAKEWLEKSIQEKD